MLYHGVFQPLCSLLGKWATLTHVTEVAHRTVAQPDLSGQCVVPLRCLLQRLVTCQIQYCRVVPLTRFSILAGMKHLCSAVRGNRRVSILVMGTAAECLVRPLDLAFPMTGSIKWLKVRHPMAYRATAVLSGHCTVLLLPCFRSHTMQVRLASLPPPSSEVCRTCILSFWRSWHSARRGRRRQCG